MDQLTIIYKAPGAAPEWRTVQNDLETLQSLVGGYIEAVPWDDHHYLVVNEEGKLQGLEINFKWTEQQDIIVGPCFWIDTAGEDFDKDFASVTDPSFFEEIYEYTRVWWENDEDEFEVGLTLGEIDDALKEIRR